MSERPTPETDAQPKSVEFGAGETYHTVSADFARKLERERDEAREALEYIAHAGLSARHIEDYANTFLRRKEAASARQRAEAFLRALGKWEEEAK